MGKKVKEDKKPPPDDVVTIYTVKSRKYGALQNLAPLVQLPLSDKINSVPTFFHMY